MGEHHAAVRNGAQAQEGCAEWPLVVGECVDRLLLEDLARRTGGLLRTVSPGDSVEGEDGFGAGQVSRDQRSED